MSDEKKGTPSSASPPPPYSQAYNQGGYGPNYPPQGQSAYPAGYSQPAPGYYNQNQTSVLVAPGAVTMNQPPPPDHMNLAIFVTLCCFWPTGIIAILKASEARSAINRGDILTAQSSSRSAKQMANISIIAGICSLVFGLVIVGIYVGVLLSY